MGIQDIRNAFLEACQDKYRVTDCRLHTIPDGNNSQRLVINGFDMNGATFEVDTGPFDAKISPLVKARELGSGVLNKQMGFRKPPQAAK